MPHTRLPLGSEAVGRLLCDSLTRKQQWVWGFPKVGSVLTSPVGLVGLRTCRPSAHGTTPRMIRDGLGN
jgi:hypothetical protein